MGVRIKCTDGLIELGGNFNSALAKVKAVEGRKYDPASKTWAVPVSVKHFDMCGHPIEVLSGNGTGRFQSGAHQTRYGNVYSRNEWDEAQKAEREASKVANEYAGKRDVIQARYQQRLANLGLSDSHIRQILVWDFDELVTVGRIKFSSEDRKRAVLEIWRAWENEIGSISQTQVEAENIAREKVYGGR